MNIWTLQQLLTDTAGERDVERFLHTDLHNLLDKGYTDEGALGFRMS